MWFLLGCSPLETWPATQARALTGNRTCNPLVLRPALNPVSVVFKPRWLASYTVLLSESGVGLSNLDFNKLSVVLLLQDRVLRALGPDEGALAI